MDLSTQPPHLIASVLKLYIRQVSFLTKWIYVIYTIDIRYCFFSLDARHLALSLKALLTTHWKNELASSLRVFASNLKKLLSIVIGWNRSQQSCEFTLAMNGKEALMTGMWWGHNIIIQHCLILSLIFSATWTTHDNKTLFWSYSTSQGKNILTIL